MRSVKTHDRRIWGSFFIPMSGDRRKRRPRGYWYYSKFIDDFSCYTFIYLQKMKGEPFQHYKECEAWFKTQKGVPIGKLHSDHGGEYLSDEFTQYLVSKGPECSLTTHDTPEKNGVAERMNYTLVDLSRAQMAGTDFLPLLWGHSLLYSAWLHNRLLSAVLESRGMSPYEAMHRRKPDLSRAHRRGSRVFAQRAAGRGAKLG